MNVTRIRIATVVIAVALVICFYFLKHWREQQRVNFARARLSEILSTTKRSILISYNESISLPLLGAQYNYELNPLDLGTQLFDGMQLQLTPTGGYNRERRELFEGAYVDLTRPSTAATSIGEYTLTSTGDLRNPAGRLIFQFAANKSLNPYQTKDDEVITLPPISFVLHDTHLEIIGLGIPETMAKGVKTSWQQRLELIVKKGPGPNAKVIATETFNVYLAEKENGDRITVSLPWHCPITNKTDLRDQQAASSPIVWQECQLSCACKVSATKSSCLSTALLELIVDLKEPLCGHPTPIADDIASLSCAAQAQQIAKRLTICETACKKLRVTKDIEVQIDNVLQPHFLGCRSYKRSADQKLPKYCDIRQNEKFTTWHNKEIVPYGAHRLGFSGYSNENPLKQLESKLKTCLKESTPK